MSYDGIKSDSRPQRLEKEGFEAALGRLKGRGAEVMFVVLRRTG